MSEQWKMPEEEDVQMPLGTGGDAGADMSFGEESKPKINASTLALVGVFAAGMLMIWLLGKQAGPRPASAEQASHDAQVQAAIAELLGSKSQDEAGKSAGKDAAGLIRLLKRESRPEVLITRDTFAEPFRRTVAVEAATIVPQTNDEEMFKLKQVAETFNALKLQSVMVGAGGGLAIINGKAVRVGQRLGDLTVTDIEAERVLLAYGKAKFELKIKSPGN